MNADHAAVAELVERVRALADSCRDRCLWFLAPDFAPTNRDEALKTLGYIERYGNRQLFIKAKELRHCLLRTFSESSSS